MQATQNKIKWMPSYEDEAEQLIIINWNKFNLSLICTRVLKKHLSKKKTLG